MSEVYQGDRITRLSDTIGVKTRADFLIRTYTHLFAAIALFTGIEIALFQSGVAQNLAQRMFGVNWLLILGAFMIVSWAASRAAHTATSPVTQYAALGGFVLAEAIIFVPLLYIADRIAPGSIRSAAMLTMTGFTGLTIVAWTTRKDFRFLAALLRWGGVVALLAIVGALVFGFHLGTWFSLAMVGFAGAAILYDTSNVLLHFPEDRHVGAALELFASVAMMFWYVLRLVNNRD